MTTRRSKNVKHLEKEVDLIFSQTEMDEDCKTPSTNKRRYDLMQTPRRSSRKSVKPSQDYEDIVNKSFKLCTRSAGKHLAIKEEIENENHNEEIKIMPKHTPAKVGRVSQKRTRKARAASTSKKHGSEAQYLEEQAINHNEDVQTKEIEIVDKLDNETEPKNQCIIVNPSEDMQGQRMYAHHKTEPNMETETEVAKITEINSVGEIVESDCKSCKQTQLDPAVHATKEQSESILTEETFETKAIRMNRENNDVKSPISCYFSDLGLNPLKEDEVEDLVTETGNVMMSNPHETEEMASLIICDDDVQLSKSCSVLNETFEANDIEINQSDANALGEMETLYLSENEDEAPNRRSPAVSPKIELQKSLILSPPGRLPITAQVPSTPKALLSTPEHKRAKLVRFPTPYINKKRVQFNNDVQENIHNMRDCGNTYSPSVMSVTASEPKEIVLRGIRKRSLSICIDGNERRNRNVLDIILDKVKSNRVVSFYSPANKTVIIDDSDMNISRTLQKQKPKESILNKFVTTRRKRSMSFDESFLSNSLLPRPVLNIATKTQTSFSVKKPSSSRTKLPNFAAIHEKQFQKMENLVEHVNRKNERSKNLINSATKFNSAKKSAPIVKKNLNNASSGKPGVVKKINLGNVSQMSKSNVNSMEAETTIVSNLPDPRMCETQYIKLRTAPRRAPNHVQTNKYLKTSQIINVNKTQSNSKTSLMVKPTTSLNFTENASKSVIDSEKTDSHLQRHMALFKGRRIHSSKTGEASRKIDMVLKGVRSNRRFELQMQHRRNLEY